MIDRFSAIHVISLDRTPERLDRFWAEFPPDWPYKPPRVCHAVDGSKCDIPAGWMPIIGQPSRANERAGAYGVYQTWMGRDGLMEQAIARDYDKPILIFEDDATIIAPDRVEAYFEALPPDWQIAFLGCEHMLMPLEMSSLVYKVSAADRLHAIAVNPSFFVELYSLWKGHRCHLDWGLRVWAGSHKFYAPVEVLCGTAANFSDIMSTNYPRRTFDPSRFAEFFFIEAPREVVDELVRLELIHLGYDRSDGGADAGIATMTRFKAELQRNAFAQWIRSLHMSASKTQTCDVGLWHHTIDLGWMREMIGKWTLVKANTVEEAIEQVPKWWSRQLQLA
jgi:hypothetical protein